MTTHRKILDLDQAINQIVADGSRIYLDGMLANRVPMAAVHQLIRARKKNLRLVSGPNSVAIDQLVGAKCVEALEFYFLGFMTNRGFASMQRFREAVEANTIRIKESMGYAICMALRAGAFGIPFIPLPDFRGSDLLKVRSDYRVIASPYNSEDSVIVVPALHPDVFLLHAHLADTQGNICIIEPWPVFTLTIAQACSRTLVTVEEIVEPGTLDSNQIVIPHFLVDAIVKVPFGAAPTALNNRYEVNQTHIAEYQDAAKTTEGFSKYLEEYVYNCPTHHEFLAKAGHPPLWTSSQIMEGKK